MTEQSYTLQALAEYLGCGFSGDAKYEVTGIATLECAGRHQITFLAQEKYKKYLTQCHAGILVARENQAEAFTGNKLLVEDPYQAYARLSQLFDRRARTSVGIHASAIIAVSAKIHKNARIGAGVVVGDNAVIGDNTEIGPGCVIGDDVCVGSDCLLHANVTLYHQVTLGHRVIIQSGAVLGSDGFGFAPSSGRWLKIHQLGGVRVGNDVEIGAGTCIDRGALTDTIIEDGVIIDNLVHIAHGVQIGEGTALAGCVGIAGSTTIGKHCTAGGMVGFAGHLTIADNCHFHGGTIVTKSITESGAYASAPPLQTVKKWRRNSVRYTQLDDMASRLKTLEKSQKE